MIKTFKNISKKFRK